MKNEVKNSERFLIHKVGKKTGFDNPSDYFGPLEKEIVSKIYENNFHKKSAFQVPENYFDALEGNLLKKIDTKTKEEQKPTSFKGRILKLIPFVAAASIALFIGLNSFVIDPKNELTIETLSNKDIEYWLEVNTITNDDIVTVLQEDITDVNEFYFTDIQDKSIEDYMNNLNNTSLWNELN